MAGQSSSFSSQIFTYHLTAATVESRDGRPGEKTKRQNYKPSSRSHLTFSLKSERIMPQNGHWNPALDSGQYGVVYVGLLYRGATKLVCYWRVGLDNIVNRLTSTGTP